MLFTASFLALILELPRLGIYRSHIMCLSKKVGEDLAHTWILSWQAGTWSGHRLKPRSCQTLPGSSVCTQFWWSTTEVHAQIFSNLLNTLTLQKSHTEWPTSSSLHWHTYKDVRLCHGLWQLSCVYSAYLHRCNKSDAARLLQPWHTQWSCQVQGQQMQKGKKAVGELENSHFYAHSHFRVPKQQLSALKH